MQVKARLRSLLLVLLVALAATCSARLEAQAPEPLRGDVDRDGELMVTDAIRLLEFLFAAGDAPYCAPVADVNADGGIDISDPIYVLRFLFIDSSPPPPLSEGDAGLCGNRPPEIPTRPVYRTYPEKPIEIPIGATDPDGDGVRYSATLLPPGSTLDESTGLFRWTPGSDQLGPHYARFTVADDRMPPRSAAGALAILVLPPDPCASLECDPASGCEAELLPLAEDCCSGEPTARVGEPEAGCPQGRVFHIGRNFFGFGRLQNCDRLPVYDLGQGGVGFTFHAEARCIDVSDFVSLTITLETPDVLLVGHYTVRRTFAARADGFYEARGMTIPILPELSPAAKEGVPAELTVSLRDPSGLGLERKLRLILTRGFPGDLPDL